MKERESDIEREGERKYIGERRDRAIKWDKQGQKFTIRPSESKQKSHNCSMT